MESKKDHPEPKIVENWDCHHGHACHYKHFTGTILDLFEQDMEHIQKIQVRLGERGFPAQTLLRIYVAKANNIDRHLEEMREKFADFQQNIAILNPHHTKAFIAWAPLYFK